MTNYHVVEGQSRVNVTVNDSTRYSGTVLGVDAVRDLAVVSICCGNFKVLEFGDATSLAAGDEVVNIGYALGIEGAATVTRGIVSALRYDSDHQAYVIQSDAPINPGNSGGPMLSPDGRVLGINSFVYVSDYGAEGIGFAISERTVQQRVPTLRGGTAIPTATPPPTSGLRPRDQWTADNPATLEELEAEIEKYRGKSFVFTSWGGAYQAAQREAYVVPFSEQFGINIMEESPMEYAVIRAMVETGNYKWHVMDVGGRELWNQINIGALEELDMSVVDNMNHVETVRTRYGGGGGITWSTVLAYNTDVYPEGSIKDWGAFFDHRNYPGRRSVRDSYRGSWFSALLSIDPRRLDDSGWKRRLGSPTDRDVEDALAIWQATPPDGFWHTGSDCPQTLISGDYDMCTAWNGRIYNAQIEGRPLAICWECGHLVGTGLFVMPEGLKQANPAAFELGQLFIAWTGHPQNNAEMSKYITYGPLNLRAASLVPTYTATAVPSSSVNLPYAIFENEKYSGEKNREWTNLWLAFQQTTY